MTNDELQQPLADSFGALTNLRVDRGILIADAPAAQLPELARGLRDDPRLKFNYLRCVSGVDPGEGKLRVAYHFMSMDLLHQLCLHVNVPRDDARIPTLSKLWGTAGWQEREIFDLFGVTFEGHADLRRILLPEDWDGHPLLKDYGYHAEGRGLFTETQVEKGLLPGPEEEAKQKEKQARAEASAAGAPAASAAPGAADGDAQPERPARDPNRPRKEPRKLGEPPRT